MSRFNPHHLAAPVHAIASEWAKRCLQNDGSMFVDDLQLWTPRLLDVLDQRFVQNLDAGEGDFYSKLETQLEPGSVDSKQLMAEALWILMLFQSNVSAGTKRENVRRVWSWSGETLQDDASGLADEQLVGLGSPAPRTIPRGGENCPSLSRPCVPSNGSMRTNVVVDFLTAGSSPPG